MDVSVNKGKKLRHSCTNWICNTHWLMQKEKGLTLDGLRSYLGLTLDGLRPYLGLKLGSRSLKTTVLK